MTIDFSLRTEDKKVSFVQEAVYVCAWIVDIYIYIYIYIYIVCVCVCVHLCMYPVLSILQCFSSSLLWQSYIPGFSTLSCEKTKLSIPDIFGPNHD